MRDESVTVAIMWQDLKPTTINASKKTIIPEMQIGKTKPWFDEKYSDIMKKKNEAHKIMI